MKLEKGKISGAELVFLMYGYLIGSSVLLPPGQQAGNMAWLAIICGLGEGLVFVFIYALLSRRFPEKTLIEINDQVYGAVFGKLVSVVFIWYLFNLGSIVVSDFHDYIKISILVQTPSSVLILTGILVFVYGAKQGIEVLARCSQGLVLITIILFLTTVVMLVSKIQINNFRPLINVPMGKFLWAAHGAGTFPFGESVVFLMIFPFLNNSKKLAKSVFLSLIIAAFFLMLASVRTIGVLGKSAELFLYPAFYATRLINIANVFTRLEIITAVNFLMMGFLKISVLIYCTSLGIAQLFKLKTYVPLVLPVGLLMGMAGLINFSNLSENIEFTNMVYPIYALPFQLGIPVLTLIIALIRGLPREGEG